MTDKPKFDENKYRQQYKRDHFDHIGFFAPKGTKEIITNRAKEMGMGLSEYMRYLIDKDTKTPTE